MQEQAVAVRVVEVAELGHVFDGSRCLASIVTEVGWERSPQRVRVQFFLPPGAMTPWPGQPHPHEPGQPTMGAWHRLDECPRRL